jgi:hypothetical protein
MNKKTFCVIQYYRVEVEVEAENEEEAKNLLYEDSNHYSLTVQTDCPDRTDILSIGVYASEALDDEVYESMPTDETRSYGPQGAYHG